LNQLIELTQLIGQETGQDKINAKAVCRENPLSAFSMHRERCPGIFISIAAGRPLPQETEPDSVLYAL